MLNIESGRSASADPLKELHAGDKSALGIKHLPVQQTALNYPELYAARDDATSGGEQTRLVDPKLDCGFQILLLAIGLVLSVFESASFHYSKSKFLYIN